MTKKELRKRLHAAEERAEFMAERRLAWQQNFYRLKQACEAGIKEGLDENRKHLAQYDSPNDGLGL